MTKNGLAMTGSPLAPDDWFQALDHRQVGTPRDHWDILVTGVHKAGRDCWIQVSSAADEAKQFVLHVTSKTTVEAALTALTAAAQQNLPTGSVLNL